MTQKQAELQPGAVLHEIIIGAFRARGTNFDTWCREHGVTPSIARNATFGQSRGPGGTKILEQMIEDAGREFVFDAYRRRMIDHVAQLKKGVA